MVEPLKRAVDCRDFNPLDGHCQNPCAPKKLFSKPKCILLRGYDPRIDSCALQMQIKPIGWTTRPPRPVVIVDPFKK